MTDKIIVEFSRRSLLKNCKNEKEESNDLLECDKCKKTDKDLVWCALYRAYKVKFKIKEQNNGNKGTED